MMKRSLQFFSLFTSTATIVCCALPALLVSLGLGASLASLLSHFPQVIWLSEYKTYIFIFSGIMIFSTHLLQLKIQSLDCPIDEKREICQNSKKDSRLILWIATVIWGIGFSFAYLFPLFL